MDSTIVLALRLRGGGNPIDPLQEFHQTSKASALVEKNRRDIAIRSFESVMYRLMPFQGGTNGFFLLSKNSVSIMKWDPKSIKSIAGKLNVSPNYVFNLGIWQYFSDSPYWDQMKREYVESLRRLEHRLLKARPMPEYQIEIDSIRPKPPASSSFRDIIDNEEGEGITKKGGHQDKTRIDQAKLALMFEQDHQMNELFKFKDVNGYFHLCPESLTIMKWDDSDQIFFFCKRKEFP